MTDPVHVQYSDTSKDLCARLLATTRPGAQSIYARLKSIVYDYETHVRRVCRGLGVMEAETSRKIPLVANIRCGAWYSPRFDSSVYFKSTDGHLGKWELSTRRRNLHLVSLLVELGTCVVLDSTKRGRMVPDSFAKTIPIWCACINRVVQRLQKKSVDEWDVALHTHPRFVSAVEHNEISTLLDVFVLKFEEHMCERDAEILRKVAKPLRPLWITPATKYVEDIDLHAMEFYPIVCFSVSEVVTTADGIVTKGNFNYIQGCADDHEAWSRGLTSSMFWKHAAYLLENEKTCEERLREVINRSKREELGEYDHIEQHMDFNGTCGDMSQYSDKLNWDTGMPPIPKSLTKKVYFNAIGETGLFVGSRLASKPPHCFEEFDVIVNCCMFEYDAFLSENEMSQGRYLWLPIPEGKRGSKTLEKLLPVALIFIAKHLCEKRKVLIHCAQGADRSVTIAMAALMLLFSKDYSFSIPTSLQPFLDNSPTLPTRKTISQFASCCQPSKDCTCLSTTPLINTLVENAALSLQVSKTQIAQTLAYITSHRSVASPCRHNLKALSRLFMTE
eukprot:Nk52_evm79s224 gene=Nk52_evmTU79s224